MSKSSFVVGVPSIGLKNEDPRPLQLLNSIPIFGVAFVFLKNSAKFISGSSSIMSEKSPVVPSPTPIVSISGLYTMTYL